MDNRKWEADAIASPPAVPTSPSDGYPTNGNPAAAQNATEPGAWWFHAVGEELRAVIEAGGLTPDIDDLTQLRDAIDARIAANIQTVPDATETVKGKVEKATAAEAQAFTADKYIDGERLASALKGANQSLAANGYQKLPGGLIIQWGVLPTLGDDSASTAVTLPISFPTACASVITTPDTFSQGANTFYVVSKSTSTFNVRHSGSVVGASSAGYYMAIGY